jgi:hypothetical protein
LGAVFLAYLPNSTRYNPFSTREGNIPLIQQCNPDYHRPPFDKIALPSTASKNEGIALDLDSTEEQYAFISEKRS